MPVNQDLATLSDAAFGSAFAIYFIAFILSVLYYLKAKSAIELQRELEEAEVAARKPALANAPAEQGLSDATTQLADATEGDPADSDRAAAEGTADTGDSGSATRSIPQLREKLKNTAARSRKYVSMTQSLVTLGAMVQAVSIVTRGLSVQRFPFGNLYEYITMITFVAVLIALVALRRKELRPVWPWVLLPILAMLYAGGRHLYAESAPVVPALQSVWLPIHVATVSIGASIGLISGMASLLYLLRMYQPRGEESGFFGKLATPLPDAQTLDRIAYKTAVVCVPVFGLGVILGAIWAESAWGRPWGWDPKETISFVTWILYAAYLHARATLGWRSKGAAWINIIAFGTMVFNLFFINLVVSGLHSYAGLN